MDIKSERKNKKKGPRFRELSAFKVQTDFIINFSLIEIHAQHEFLIINYFKSCRIIFK